MNLESRRLLLLEITWDDLKNIQDFQFMEVFPILNSIKQKLYQFFFKPESGPSYNR
jgi:hypothetical protein